MTILEAREIAIKDLRSCYGPEGIFAGGTHFRNYWARDSCFASLAALSLGDRAIVKKNIDTFLRHQRSDGAIPMRIGARWIILPLLGLPSTQGVSYTEDKRGHDVLDSNLLIVVAARAYVESVDDAKFKKTIIPRLEKSLEWASANAGEDGLLIEKSYSGWMDSVKKSGATLYSNLLFWKALKDMAAITGVRKYGQRAVAVRKSMMDVLWNGEFLDDWVDGKKHNFFAIGEHALACLWGFFSEKKRLAIEKKLSSIPANHPPSLPPYPRGVQSISMRLISMGGYHAAVQWLWVEAIRLAAIKKNYPREYKIGMERLAASILHYGVCHEIYDMNGAPFRSLAYSSERPFAWTAAMFILAANGMKHSQDI